MSVLITLEEFIMTSPCLTLMCTSFPLTVFALRNSKVFLGIYKYEINLIGSSGLIIIKIIKVLAGKCR
jgi:hypothetical protein